MIKNKINKQKTATLTMITILVLVMLVGCNKASETDSKQYNFHLWEEYVSYYMEVYEGIADKNYPTDYYWSLNDNISSDSNDSNDNKDENQNLVVHNNKYSKADLNKLPIFPQVTYDKDIRLLNKNPRTKEHILINAPLS